MIDPRDRFSNRAADYARARPSYPSAAIDVLRTHHGLQRGTVVADVGAGTGIFTKLLLDAGAIVHAIEPNADMRAEAKRSFGIEAIAGSAENTTLPDASIDLVTAAQAFHWFDVDRFKREAARILRPEGRIALVWNDRDLASTPFVRDYEAILVEHCQGYAALQGKSDTPKKFDAVFGAGGWTRHAVPNAQRLSRDGLVDRVMSSSYAPPRERSEPLARALENAFDHHAVGGEVEIGYATVIIGGRPLR